MTIKCVTIYYFSGTGNTELVVKLLRASLLATGSQTELRRVEDYLTDSVPNSSQLIHSDVIGIAFPVHAFHTPRIVHEFVDRSLGPGKGKPVFLLSTSSAPFDWNDHATITLIRSLRRKGYYVFNERMVVLSANIVYLYPDSLIKQLYEAAQWHCNELAQDILTLSVGLKPHRWLPTLIHYLGALETRYRKYATKYLHVEGCSSCTWCVRQCPTKNIQMEQGSIRFGENCITCLRCVYGCPELAIKPKKLKWALIQGNYNIKYNMKRILEDHTIPANYVTATTKGYYSIFKDYLRIEHKKKSH